ncbi:unnamed protein product [Cochlearia groenlandica]
MLQEMVSSHDQLSIDDIKSPLSAQFFDFSDPQMFQETYNNQTSDEVNSASNILDNNSGNSTTDNNNNNINNNTYKDDEDVNNNNNNDNNADLSIIFDPQEDFETDIAASIDFSSTSLQYPVIDHLLTTTTTTEQDQFGFTSGVQVIPPSSNFLYNGGGDPLTATEVSSLAHNQTLPLGVFEEDCLSSVPSYNLGLNPTSSYFRNSGLPAYMVNMNTGLLSSDSNSGLFTGNIHLGTDFNKPPHDQFMDFQADNGGFFGIDSIKHIYNPGDFQALSGVENQSKLVLQNTNSTTKPVDITEVEDPTLNKVAKLSPEQRKERIHRYMKKRNERNFNKKIKYACRKTLADSRPRVRGRFAKNDELSELIKQGSSSHHVDEDDMGVKDEEQLVDSSDIFAHISGPNSFKCNYPIQSWI